jgi:hypothetical protein
MGQDGSLGKETDKTNSGENLKEKGETDRYMKGQIQESVQVGTNKYYGSSTKFGSVRLATK